ncbi:MAG TPA: type II toxin-antitoxin system PemK/MazF family toxin, partial [Thermoanaerobaculia bacterium]
PKGEPKRSRIFCIASRAALIGSSFSTVTRAPIYSARHGLSIQVLVGPEEGLKHESPILCDELVSFPKSALTDYVGTLSGSRLEDLNRALAIALELA